MSTQEEKYNGWSNWETWNVDLWLTNDQSIYNTVQDLIEQKFEYEFQREEALRNLVYDLIHGNEEEGISKYITDDISLHRVNYREIIDSFTDQVFVKTKKQK